MNFPIHSQKTLGPRPSCVLVLASSPPIKALFSSEKLALNKTFSIVHSIGAAITVFRLERPKFVFIEESMLSSDDELRRIFMDLIGRDSGVIVHLLEDEVDLNLNPDLNPRVRQKGIGLMEKPYSINQITSICCLR